MASAAAITKALSKAGFAPVGRVSAAAISRVLAKDGFDPDQPRDDEGKWTRAGAAGRMAAGITPGIMSMTGGGVGGGGGGAPFGRDPEGRPYGSMEERFTAAGGMRSTARATVGEREAAGAGTEAPRVGRPKNRAEANQQFWRSLGGRRQAEIIDTRDRTDPGYKERYRDMSSEASREQSMATWYAETYLPKSTAAVTNPNSTEYLDRRKLEGFYRLVESQQRQDVLEEQRAAAVSEAEQVRQQITEAMQEAPRGRVRAALASIADRTIVGARHAIDIASALVDEDDTGGAARAVTMAGSLLAVSTALAVAVRSREPKTLVNQAKSALKALRTARKTAPLMRKDAKAAVRRLKRQLPRAQRKIDRALKEAARRGEPIGRFASRFAEQAASRARFAAQAASRTSERLGRGVFTATGGRITTPESRRAAYLSTIRPTPRRLRRPPRFPHEVIRPR